MIINDLIKITNIYYNSLLKFSKIKKLPNGKYRVVSKKGKNLGTYNTKQEAEKRLKQVEFFKHKKAEKQISYSIIIRDLNKNNKEKADEFRKVFKKNFDEALLGNIKEPENIALIQTIEEIGKDIITKQASAIDLGNPEFAGKYLADILKFIMKRISKEKRPKSLENLKKKVFYINEYDIASKKVPASSAIGTSITLLKHILLDHDPKYIRNVLNAVSRNL